MMFLKPSWRVTLMLLMQILLCILVARDFAGREGINTKEDRTLFRSETGKVLITGTGRSGTTFLIQLFTFLDLDTGYDSKNYSKHISDNCSSGMERPLNDPYKYLKNPNIQRMGRDMERLLINTTIQAVIIPIRNYTESALSRVHLGENANGGLWGGASDLSSQEKMYYEIMANFLLSMVVYDIATIFIDYKRMVSDPVYLYRKLRQVLPSDISVKEFTDAFQEASEVNERAREKRKGGGG